MANKSILGAGALISLLIIIIRITTTVVIRHTGNLLRGVNQLALQDATPYSSLPPNSTQGS